jgi:hypothetical protein
MQDIKQFVSLRESLLREKKQIEQRLESINEAIGGMPLPSMAPVSRAAAPSSSGRSAEWRARIAAAQRARWAERRKGQPAKATASTGAAATGGRRKLSPAARAKIAEIVRRRWAAAKKAGRSKL